MDNISLLFPEKIDWEEVRKSAPEPVFSGQVIHFLNELSRGLLRDPQSRLYPDVVTFAFFCRKANLVLQKKKYSSDELRLGKGILFHIAPSNVPVNFAYSLVAGLLAGNCNIVKISSKEFPQVDLIIRHLKKIAEKGEHAEALSKVILVRYDSRREENTAFFSQWCDVRIIWGGDHTIRMIRKNEIGARATDVTFADRYSLAVLNADELIREPAMEKVAQGFYNDTYLFDQNACSSPHLIVWLGGKENRAKAQALFWDAVHREVKSRYEFQAILSIDKLTNFYLQSLGMAVSRSNGYDNTLVRVSLAKLDQEIEHYRGRGGYFCEYEAECLDELAGIIKRNYQTLAYYKMDREELKRFVIHNRLTGIDRIVPVGETTAFSLLWDGNDLIRSFSREVHLI